MSTIFAPITGPGGAVTVLRLSGPAAFQITETLTEKRPAPRFATLKKLRHNHETLDTALVTAFPAPHSFTGEDCVEFSLHGGRAVRHAVIDALTELGARLAEPGEFSRRAYLNNRLDLLQAEANADLIAAETQAQRRLAIEGANRLHTACAAWRETLRHLIAQQEALIDFPDEDLPPQVEARLIAGIDTLHKEMQAALAAAPNAERLREGLEFVILGPPNAGKSTLLNALAGADIAIVSETPGTTRDAISVKLDLAGIPVHITDTAGLRETADPIEAEGIRRAYAHAAKADLIIHIDDRAIPQPAAQGVETLHIQTKADLAASRPPNVGWAERSEAHPLAPPSQQDLAASRPPNAISAKTGAGMPELLAALTAIAQRLTDTSGTATLARPRQIACIRDTAAALACALANPEPELRGEDLRTAATALARLTGAIGVEAILDAVFSGFCIGK
jgi:tRNA modification GTPase